MGFSFRNLYTEEGRSEQGGDSVLLQRAEGAQDLSGQASIKGNPAISLAGRPVTLGIPGALKSSSPLLEEDPLVAAPPSESGFACLDELEPESMEEGTRSTVVSDQKGLRDDTGGADLLVQQREAQIKLRAVFSIAGSFTVERVAVLTASLLGVESCLLCSGRGAMTALADSQEVVPVEQIEDFPQLDIFQPALDLMRMGKLDGVMLRSQEGVISYFSYGEFSLMVSHENEELQPGLWEKLLLITQAASHLSG